MIQFFVAGKPQQKGSKKAMPNGCVVDMNKKAAPWQSTVQLTAAQEHRDGPLTCPVHVRLTFHMPRPQRVPKGRRGWPATTPDIDKLARTALDGLTGVCFTDDKLVCALDVSKQYSDRPGVFVEVDKLPRIKP